MSYGAGFWDLLLAKFDSDGNTCMGEFVTPTVQSISDSIGTPSPTVTSHSLASISPTFTVRSPNLTLTDACLVGAVELALFNAVGHDDHVEIEWSTATEIDNGGFNIHRSMSEEDGRSKLNEVMIPARGSSIDGAKYSFTDYDVINGTTYYYWLEDIDLNGNSSMEGPVCVTAGAINGGEVPADFSLTQNYPNPFNPVTEIEYDLPVDCHVTLEIHDVLGRSVAVLVDEHQKAGSRIVRWDGRDENGADVTSGVYFCKLVAGGYTEVKKMTLLR